MPSINEIDYNNLAHIAKTSRISFASLCERAEKGLSLGFGILDDGSEWVSYSMAARILNIGQPTLSVMMTQQGNDLEYWGVKWKTRSLVKPKGKRGCGVLFKRADLVVIKNIRTNAQISLGSAFKVFQAMEKGLI